jgi:hypothetical protein
MIFKKFLRSKNYIIYNLGGKNETRDEKIRRKESKGNN